MNQLVTLTNGQAVTTTLAVADGTDTKHKNVLELTRTYLADLEEFGRVAFETRPFETSGGIQQREIAILNEHHATLLITFMRNNGIVRDFKKRLVKAFWELKTQSQHKVPTSLGEALFLAAKLESEREAFAKQIEADRPKVAFFEAVAQAEDSNMMLREAAKVLGTGERRLRNLLRDKQYLMKDGLPYQCYIERGLFEVKERVTRNQYGKAVVYSVALVTPKGMIHLQEKFFPPSAKQLPLQWPANPFPEGMREDSATSRVYKLLKENPDIWFTAGQLESLTKAKRGGISWAIRQLRKEGLIEHSADDARNPAYFQYRLASAIKAA